jgi:hypothetical protein
LMVLSMWSILPHWLIIWNKPRNFRNIRFSIPSRYNSLCVFEFDRCFNFLTFFCDRAASQLLNLSGPSRRAS